MDLITIDSPLDMHVHLRSGDMLRFVAPITASLFSGALVMPNTDPVISSVERLLEYRQEIQQAVKDITFFPFMTAYFQTTYTRANLEKMREHVLAIKLYPKGVTTNSDHGVDVSDPQVEKVIGYMQELGIPLCVHGESKGYIMWREAEFQQVYERWAAMFPKLKIIMEHISTADLVPLLSWNENVYATITPHHLLYTTDALLADGCRPHMYAKPILKTPPDRATLQELVLGGRGKKVANKVMLGTDSAPHTDAKKYCDCGCAGIFNAPVTLQLLANFFAQRSYVEGLQPFVSDNARRIYGINPPRKTVYLSRTPFVVPNSYADIKPLCAGEELPWSIDRVFIPQPENGNLQNLD